LRGGEFSEFSILELRVSDSITDSKIISSLPSLLRSLLLAIRNTGVNGARGGEGDCEANIRGSRCLGYPAISKKIPNVGPLWGGYALGNEGGCEANV
jgi:hypothetical protein